MLDIQELLVGYQNYWWSPVPGTRYLDEQSRGPGRQACKHPGAFNLYWLLYDLPLPSDPLFLQFCRKTSFSFGVLQGIAQLEADGIPINEWATTHNQKEFANWLNLNHSRIHHWKAALPALDSAKSFNETVQRRLAKLEHLS